MNKPHRHRRNWTARELGLLGTATDAVIARRIGRTRRSVMGKRQLLGIAPVVKVNPWPASVTAMLGTMPDREVAERSGYSHVWVAMMRKKLGIKAWGRKGGSKSCST